jgi:hypothetical protein
VDVQIIQHQMYGAGLRITGSECAASVGNGESVPPLR